MQYECKPALGEPQLFISALGESIPLSSGSIDLGVCFNALDHMRDPASAIAEMARVLRPHGTALFLIHTFPAWLRPLYWADRTQPITPRRLSFPDSSRTGFRLTVQKLRAAGLKSRRGNGASLRPGSTSGYKFCSFQYLLSIHHLNLETDLDPSPDDFERSLVRIVFQQVGRKIAAGMLDVELRLRLCIESLDQFIETRLPSDENDLLEHDLTPETQHFRRASGAGPATR